MVPVIRVTGERHLGPEPQLYVMAGFQPVVYRPKAWRRSLVGAPGDANAI